jgi:transposase
MASLVECLVPDDLWSLFRHVVPPVEITRPQGGGRRRADDREILAAIIFVATTDCTWRELPSAFGPAWPTVYRRFAQWSQERVWTRLHHALLSQPADHRESVWTHRAITSVGIRATHSHN